MDWNPKREKAGENTDETFIKFYTVHTMKIVRSADFNTALDHSSHESENEEVNNEEEESEYIEEISTTKNKKLKNKNAQKKRTC
jgi:hypothetical protein